MFKTFVTLRSRHASYINWMLNTVYYLVRLGWVCSCSTVSTGLIMGVHLTEMSSV